MKRSIILAAAAVVALSPAAASAAGNGNGNGGSNGAGGVTGAAFYVDGALYRTVGTPTDLSGTGAPAHSFDTIYAIDGQPNVATAAPGDADYNGGRWRVQVVAIADRDAALMAADADGDGVLDSADEVHHAISLGLAEIAGDGPSFVCPVIPLPSR